MNYVNDKYPDVTCDWDGHTLKVNVQPLYDEIERERARSRSGAWAQEAYGFGNEALTREIKELRADNERMAAKLLSQAIGGPSAQRAREVTAWNNMLREIARLRNEVEQRDKALLGNSQLVADLRKQNDELRQQACIVPSGLGGIIVFATPEEARAHVARDKGRLHSANARVKELEESLAEYESADERDEDDLEDDDGVDHRQDEPDLDPPQSHGKPGFDVPPGCHYPNSYDPVACRDCSYIK
jgi:hypothetical protein